MVRLSVIQRKWFIMVCFLSLPSLFVFSLLAVDQAVGQSVYDWNTWAVEWSPLGDRIAIGYGDGTVEVIDAASGQHVFNSVLSDPFVLDVAWKPDGTQVAACGGQDIQIFDLASGQAVLTIRDPLQSMSMSWSPDGTKLANTHQFERGPLAQYTTKVRDANTGDLLFKLTGYHTQSLSSVAWNHDGTKLVTGGNDSQIIVWDVASQTPITILEHPGALNTVAWSQDGTRLASIGRDPENVARVWDATTGAVVFSYTGSDTYDIAWHPNDKWLALTDANTVKIFDSTSLELIDSFNSSEPVLAVDWSPDGTQLAYGGESGTVEIREVDIQPPVANAGLDQTITDNDGDGSETVTLDGSGSTDSDGIIISYQWHEDGNLIAEGTAPEVSLAIGVHEITLTVTDDDGATDQDTVVITVESEPLPAFEPLSACWVRDWNQAQTEWHIDNPNPVPLSTNPEVKVRYNWAAYDAFDAQGSAVQAATGWDDANPNPVNTPLAISPTPVLRAKTQSSIQAITWSPEGDRIAAGYEDGTVRILDATTGQVIHTLLGHASEVTSLVWKPDGQQLISGNFDIDRDLEITARVWNTETGQFLAMLPDISSTSVLGLSWSLDNTQIITFGFDATPNVKIWDAETFQLISGETKNGDVVQIAWRPDHTLVALANTVGKIILADPLTFDPLMRLEESMASSGAIGGVYAVAWSPDGSIIAGGNTAGTVRLWDATNGQNLMNRNGADHQEQGWNTTAIRALHFRSSVPWLTSVAADGTLRTWDVETGNIVSTEQLPGAPIYAAAWSPDGTQLAYGGESGTVEIREVDIQSKNR